MSTYDFALDVLIVSPMKGRLFHHQQYGERFGDSGHQGDENRWSARIVLNLVVNEPSSRGLGVPI